MAWRNGLQSAGFNIPKKKNNEILQKVGLTSRDAQDLLTEVDHSFLDHKYKQQWKLSNVEFVRSPHVEKLYRAKRSELKEEGRNLQEQLCFLSVNQKFLATKIAREGLRVKAQTHHTLGNSSQGVYLWKHIDTQLRVVEKGDAFILVFKVTPGKIKSVPPANSSAVEPTPNFDCHVSNLQPRPSDSVRDQFKRAQIYLYEYTEDAEPSKQPRHCLPYALLQYCQKDIAEKNEVSAYNVSKPNRVAPQNVGASWTVAGRRTSLEMARNVPAEVQKTSVGDQSSTSKSHSKDSTRPLTPPPTPSDMDSMCSPVGKENSSEPQVQNQMDTYPHTEHPGPHDDNGRQSDALSCHTHSEDSAHRDQSDDELDEQMQSIIRQPLINRTRSLSLNVARDPRIRRHSQESTQKEMLSESGPVTVSDRVQRLSAESHQTKTPISSSVMQSMMKTVDRLLGRGSSVQSEPQDDSRQKLYNDPFNSWGLTWREENRWTRDERGERQPFTNANSNVYGQRGSSSRGSGHPHPVRERETPISHLLDTRPSGLSEHLLSDRDLAALVSMDTQAKKPEDSSDQLPFKQIPVRIQPPGLRAPGGNSGTEGIGSEGREMDGRLSVDEDGDFMVIDEYRCSEAEESDCQSSDIGGGSPRIPRRPVEQAPSHIVSNMGASQIQIESVPQQAARPLKSALKKTALPDTVFAKVKKKLSLGDYKLLKQKMRTQTEDKVDHTCSTVVGETVSDSSASIGAPASDRVHLSESSESLGGKNLSEPLPSSSTSPPNAFSVLLSNTGSLNAPCAENTTTMDSRAEISQTLHKNAAFNSSCTRGLQQIGASGAVLQLTSFEKLSAKLQSVSRDPRLRSAMSTLCNNQTSSERNNTNDDRQTIPDAGETGATSNSKYTQKSPLLDRLAKMCHSEQSCSSNGSSRVLLGHMSPAGTGDSEVRARVMDASEGTKAVPDSRKTAEDGTTSQGDEGEICLNQTVQSQPSISVQERTACDEEGEKPEESTQKTLMEKPDKSKLSVPGVEEKDSPETNQADQTQSCGSVGVGSFVETSEPVGAIDSVEDSLPDEVDRGTEPPEKRTESENSSAKSGAAKDALKKTISLKEKIQVKTSENKNDDSKSDVTASQSTERRTDDEGVPSADLATLVRIAKGLRPGPSNRGPSPEAHTSAKSSAWSSKESSPDLSKLTTTSAEDGVNTSGKTTVLKKPNVPGKDKPKGKGRRSVDTSPESEIPVNEEEFEAMVRLAKGLRPGRKIQVTGLGKNPTDEPLPVLEGRGRYKSSLNRGKKTAVETAGKGSRSSSIAGSDSDAHQDKTSRQRRKKTKRTGGKKKKRVKIEDQEKTTSKAGTMVHHSPGDEDFNYLDFKFDAPVDLGISAPDDGRAEAAVGSGSGSVHVKQEPVDAEEKFKALPISALGIRHWMEALLMPSLNPQVLLTDLVMAYLKGADFDNCSICQKVIDLAAIEDAAEETPSLHEETPSADDRTEELAGQDGGSALSPPAANTALVECKIKGNSMESEAVSLPAEPSEAVPASPVNTSDNSHSQTAVLSEISTTTLEPQPKNSVPILQSASSSTEREHTAVIPGSETSSSTMSDMGPAKDTNTPGGVSDEPDAETGTSNNLPGTVPEFSVSSHEDPLPPDAPSFTQDAAQKNISSEVSSPVASADAGDAVSKESSDCAAISVDSTLVSPVSQDQVHAEAESQSGVDNSTLVEDLSSTAQISQAMSETFGVDERSGGYTSSIPSNPPFDSSCVTDDSVLATGFWMHPDEIENMNVQQNSPDKRQRTRRLSCSDTALYKRSHSADEVEVTSHKRPKVSQPWSGQNTPIHSPDIFRRQDQLGSDLQQNCSAKQSSTKQSWQQWKSSQAARARRDEVTDKERNAINDLTTLPGNQGSTEDMQDHDYRRGREPISSSILVGTTPMPSCPQMTSAESRPGYNAVSQPLLPAVHTPQLNPSPHEIANDFQDLDYRPGRGMVHHNTHVGTGSLLSSCSETSVSACAVPQSTIPVVQTSETDPVQRSQAEGALDVSRSQTDPSQGQGVNVFEIINKLKMYSSRKEIPGLDLIMGQSGNVTASVSQALQEDKSAQGSASEDVPSTSTSERPLSNVSGADRWSACAQSFLQNYQLLTHAKEPKAGSKTHQSLSANPEVIEALRKKYSTQREEKNRESTSEAGMVNDDSVTDKNRVTDCVLDAEMDTSDSIPDGDMKASEHMPETEMAASESASLEEIRLNINTDLHVTSTHSGVSLDKTRYEMSGYLKRKTDSRIEVSSELDKINIEKLDRDSSEEAHAKPAEKEHFDPQPVSSPVHHIPSLLSTRGTPAKKNENQNGNEIQRTVIPVQADPHFPAHYHRFVANPGQPAPPGVQMDREDSLPGDLQSSEPTPCTVSNQLSTASVLRVRQSSPEVSRGQGKKNAYDWFACMLDGRPDNSDGGNQEAGPKEGRLECMEAPQTEPKRDAVPVVNVSSGQPPPPGIPTIPSQPQFDHAVIRPSFAPSVAMEGPPLFQQAAPLARYPVVPAFHPSMEPLQAPFFVRPVPPPGPIVHRGISPQERVPHFQQTGMPGPFFGTLSNVPGIGGPGSVPPVSLPVGIVSPMIQGVPPPGMTSTGPEPTSAYFRQPVNSTLSSLPVAASSAVSSREPEPPGTQDPTEDIPLPDSGCRMDTSEDKGRKESKSDKRDLLHWFSHILEGKRDVSPEREYEPEVKKARMERKVSPKRSRRSREKESDNKKARAEREGSSSSAKSHKSSSSSGKPTSLPSKSKSGSEKSVSKISFKVSANAQPRKRLQRTVSWESDSECSDTDDKDNNRGNSEKKEKSTDRNKGSVKRDVPEKDQPLEGGLRKDTHIKPSNTHPTHPREDTHHSKSRSSQEKNDRMKSGRSRWDLMKKKPHTDMPRDKKGEEESEGLDEFADALLEGAVGNPLKDQPSNIATAVMRSTSSDSSNPSPSVQTVCAGGKSQSDSLPGKSSDKSFNKTDDKNAPERGSDLQKEKSAAAAQVGCADKETPDAGVVKNNGVAEGSTRSAETRGSGSNTSLADKPLEYLAFAREMILKEMERLQGVSSSQSDSEDQRQTTSPTLKVASPSVQQIQPNAADCHEEKDTRVPIISEITSEHQQQEQSIHAENCCLDQASTDEGQSSSAKLDTRDVVVATPFSVPEKMHPGDTTDRDTRTVIAKAPMSFSDAPVTEEEMSALKNLFLKSSAVASTTSTQPARDSAPGKPPATGVKGKPVVPSITQSSLCDRGSSKVEPGPLSDTKAGSFDKKKEENNTLAKRVKRNSGGQAWSEFLMSEAGNSKTEVVHRKHSNEKSVLAVKENSVKPKEDKQKHQQPSVQKETVQKGQPKQQPQQQQQAVQERSQQQHAVQKEQPQQQLHPQPSTSQPKPGGSQSTPAGKHSETLRDFLVEKFQVKNPEKLAPLLPYKLTFEMSKLSKKQRKKLRTHILLNLDKASDDQPENALLSPTPTDLPLEKYPEDQIHIELGLVQECLNLLEAIQVTRPPQAADGNMWNTNHISIPGQPSTAQGSAEGMQFIEQTYRAQSMYSKVRDSLLSVLADFSTAIKDAQTNSRGRGHQHLPVAALLPEEVGKIYSVEGISLIQLTAVHHSAFAKLVQLKDDIETCLRRQRTFVCSNNTLPARLEKERVNKFHALRANLLSTFCGRINKQRLNRLEMAVQRYSICQDHLKRVLGEESVAKMTFFQAMSAAIRNHRQLVAKEMAGLAPVSRAPFRGRR